MTYEEKKKLIEVAMILKGYCKGRKCDNDCIFFDGSSYGNCRINDTPDDWEIPKLTRWTSEEVALAKALKAVVVTAISRDENGNLRLLKGYAHIGTLPNDLYLSLGHEEAIDLDTIIKEAEG